MTRSLRPFLYAPKILKSLLVAVVSEIGEWSKNATEEQSPHLCNATAHIRCAVREIEEFIVKGETLPPISATYITHMMSTTGAGNLCQERVVPLPDDKRTANRTLVTCPECIAMLKTYNPIDESS